MFNDLNEHPLFKQRKSQLNENEDLVTGTINLEINIAKKRTLIPCDSTMKSKSKSVSDLLDKDGLKIDDNHEIEKQNDLNSSSSCYLLDSYHDDTDETILPFPIPNKNDLIKSRTDLDLDESPKLRNHFNPPLVTLNNDILYNQNDERRLELLHNLIVKEKQYLVIIKILIHEYYFQFTNNHNFNQLVSSNDLEIIFNHLNDLYDLHKLNILPELERREKDWFSLSDSNRIVCDIFVKHMKKINFYNDYIDNFVKSVECLNKYCSKNNFQLKSTLCLLDIKVKNRFVS
jgi:hypothetical protein